MSTSSRINWLTPVKVGLIAGITALLVSLVGLLEAAHRRFIIPGVLSMGQTIMLLMFVFAGYMAVRRIQGESEDAPKTTLVLGGALAGLVCSAFPGGTGVDRQRRKPTSGAGQCLFATI